MSDRRLFVTLHHGELGETQRIEHHVDYWLRLSVAWGDYEVELTANVPGQGYHEPALVIMLRNPPAGRGVVDKVWYLYSGAMCPTEAHEHQWREAEQRAKEIVAAGKILPWDPVTEELADMMEGK